MKKFQKIPLSSFTSPIQKSTLGFTIYLKSWKKSYAHMCLQNAIQKLLHQLWKIIKNIREVLQEIDILLPPTTTARSTKS